MSDITWYMFFDDNDDLLSQAGFLSDEAAEMCAEALAKRYHTRVTYYLECGAIEKPPAENA